MRRSELACQTDRGHHDDGVIISLGNSTDVEKRCEMWGDAQFQNIALMKTCVRISIRCREDDFSNDGVRCGWSVFISLGVCSQLDDKALGNDVILGEFASFGDLVSAFQIGAEGFVPIVRQVAVQQASVDRSKLSWREDKITVAKRGCG